VIDGESGHLTTVICMFSYNKIVKSKFEIDCVYDINMKFDQI